MADNNKEVVRAIEKMNREVCRTLSEIGRQMNKALGRMAEALEQKQFDELVPPPKGTVYQNMRGTTLIGSEDFNEVYDVWRRANEGGVSEEYEVGDEE